MNIISVSDLPGGIAGVLITHLYVNQYLSIRISIYKIAKTTTTKVLHANSQIDTAKVLSKSNFI